MKHALALCTVLLLSVNSLSQHQHSAGDSKPATMIAGLGEVHHKVSTSNPEAQRFFDQGLALVYGFNHEEGIRSFNKATELDPQLAMAHWGVALALGPNINMDVDPDREKAAYEAIQRALKLAPKASEAERDYINALAKRYSNDPKADLKKLNADYRVAMREVTKRYPDDPDAATLYAESIMLLSPWQYWLSDGRPGPGTLEMVAVLETVLRRDPQHLGANHYYIHAVEASPNPEWALPSAQRLKVLAPAAGHLVHMPAHIDIRSGNYDAAARSNAYAAEADREYFKLTGQQGMYPMMYYSHNLHFLAVAHAMQGRFSDSTRAANQLDAHLRTFLQRDATSADPFLAVIDTFLPTTTLILIRFHRWDEILKLQTPDKKLTASTILWHAGRALAYASTGRVEDAEKERSLMQAALKSFPAERPYGFNKASDVFAIPQELVNARIALAKKDRTAGLGALKKAVQLEDALSYDEPEDWYIPSREALGGQLMIAGDYKEAEKVFRAELEKHRRNGRALFGLMESLKAQGRTDVADFVRRQFEDAWQNADIKLRIEDL